MEHLPVGLAARCAGGAVVSNPYILFYGYTAGMRGAYCSVQELRAAVAQAQGCGFSTCAVKQDTYQPGPELCSQWELPAT